MQECDDGGNFHFLRFNFLSQKFGCPSHHQSGYKYCDNHEHIKIEKSHTDAAKKTVYHHTHHGKHTREWREAVVHGIHRSIGSNGGGNPPESGGCRTETNFFAFHTSQVLGYSHLCDRRVSVHFKINGWNQET